MSCLRSPAAQLTRNVVRLGVATNAPSKAARQPHQMRVVQRRVRSGQLPPPQAETTWIMSHPEIPVQHDAINAIIAAAQEILIKRAQPLAHEGHATYLVTLVKLPRRGHFFAAPSLRKSVAHLIRQIL